METEDQTSAPEITSQLPHLVEVLETLKVQIVKQNSLKYALLRGMVYGLGTVIGASVLVALLGGIIATTINSFTDEPINFTIGKNN